MCIYMYMYVCACLCVRERMSEQMSKCSLVTEPLPSGLGATLSVHVRACTCIYMYVCVCVCEAMVRHIWRNQFPLNERTCIVVIPYGTTLKELQTNLMN